MSEDEELREQAKQRLLEALQGDDEKRAFEAAKSLYSFRAAAPPDSPAVAGQQALERWQVNLEALKQVWLQIAPTVECPACGAAVGWNGGEAVLVEEAIA